MPNRFVATALGEAIAETFRNELKWSDTELLRAVVRKVEGVVSEISSPKLRREILLETLTHLTLVEWDHARYAHFLGHLMVLEEEGRQAFPVEAFISAYEKLNYQLINKYIEVYRLRLLSQ